jgi:hypothetical protein
LKKVLVFAKANAGIVQRLEEDSGIKGGITMLLPVESLENKHTEYE